MRTVRYIIVILYVMVLSCTVGVKTEQDRDTVLALVNSTPITAEDLLYALSIEHRREDLSSAGSFDIKEFLQRLIDDRLLVEEAIRMGLDRTQWVQDRLNEYIISESVNRLYREEIASRIEITEEQLREFYRDNYRVFELAIIETPDREKILKAEKELSEGVEFMKVLSRYSTNKRGTFRYTKLALSKSPEFQERVLGLKPGQITDVFKIENKYYIVKLIRIEPADEGLFLKRKAEVKRQLKKQKEKVISERYLAELKKQVKIWKNDELIEEIKGLRDKEFNLTELKKDKRVLARVNNIELTVARVFSSNPPPRPDRIERIVEGWINRKVVDIEALKRQYYTRPPLKQQVQRYKEQLLKRVFIGTVILPQIDRSEEVIRQYYEKHKQRYRAPDSYKIQQIFLKTEEDAEDVMRQLRSGADFTWLARTRSVDPSSKRGGDRGWFSAHALPEPLKKAFSRFAVGQISDIFKDGNYYSIARIADVRRGQIPPFERIRNRVTSDYLKDAIERKIRQYVAQLRKDAEIIMYEENIIALQKRFD